MLKTEPYLSKILIADVDHKHFVNSRRWAKGKKNHLYFTTFQLDFFTISIHILSHCLHCDRPTEKVLERSFCITKVALTVLLYLGHKLLYISRLTSGLKMMNSSVVLKTSVTSTWLKSIHFVSQLSQQKVISE